MNLPGFPTIHGRSIVSQSLHHLKLAFPGKTIPKGPTLPWYLVLIIHYIQVKAIYSSAHPLLSLSLSLYTFSITALLGYCSNLSLRKDKDEIWYCKQDTGRTLMRYHILSSPQLSCVAGREALISMKSKFHWSNSNPPY